VSVPSAGQQSPGRIVVEVDGSSSSEDALRWAAEQGRLTHASCPVVVHPGVPESPSAP
jgi:hypothetical protein